MDIASLQAFVIVADSGSFSVAADQLRLTQPAISKRIAALETDLNVRLFDRLGRAVRLTEAGTVLLPRARLILSEVEESSAFLDSLTSLGMTENGAYKTASTEHKVPLPYP